MSDNDHSSLNLTEAKEEEVSEIVDTKRNSAMWFFRNLGGRRSNQFHTLIKMLMTTIFCVVKRNRVSYLKMKKIKEFSKNEFSTYLQIKTTTATVSKKVKAVAVSSLHDQIIFSRVLNPKC